MKLNKLLLTTSLVPIAVVPAMVSCNKNTGTEIGSDELTYFEGDVYCPEKAHVHKETFFMYKKGVHSFTINQIKTGFAIDCFLLIQPSHEVPTKPLFDSWKVLHNGTNVSENWKFIENYVLVTDEEFPIESGKLVFEVNLVEDTVCVPIANQDS